jgi:hypothetical protein
MTAERTGVKKSEKKLLWDLLLGLKFTILGASEGEPIEKGETKPKFMAVTLGECERCFIQVTSP